MTVDVYQIFTTNLIIERGYLRAGPTGTQGRGRSRRLRIGP